MSDIQRWDLWNEYAEVCTPERDGLASDTGCFVTYADHVDKLREAEIEWRSAADAGWAQGYEQGRVDERKRSVLLIADAYKQGRERGQRDERAEWTALMECPVCAPAIAAIQGDNDE